MSQWEIQPFRSLGEINLGDSRDAIRRQLGPEFETFKKGSVSPPPFSPMVDAYDALHLHLYYDFDDRLIIIGVFPPTIPVFQGVKLLGAPLNQIVEEMMRLGQQAVFMCSGCHFEALGLSLYVPYDEKLDSVSVYDRTWFERDLQMWRESHERQKAREERRKKLGPIKNPFEQ